MALRPLFRWTAAVVTLMGVVFFLMSLSYNWWGMAMFAPQYPEGLEAIASLHGMSGDIDEINELNHYIGMMNLDNAAKTERKLAVPTVYAFSALTLLALFTQRRWLNWLLRLPLITFPALFLLDLRIWLWYAGHHLAPKAALNHVISSFTPVMLGEGVVVQFRTVGWLEPGFWWAVAGASCVLGAAVLVSLRPAREG